jgi:protein-S-isoprenylcysteine O-methyltransferase Ste14
MISQFEALVATLVLVGLFGCSFVLYFRRPLEVRKREDLIEEVPSFRLLAKIIQISTLALAVASLWLPNSELVLFRGRPFLTAGLSLAVVGMGMFVAAKRSLGSAYSHCYESYVPDHVVHAGIYRLFRHPIYVGNTLCLVGIFVATGSALLLPCLMATAGYYWRSARVEERALSERLPGYRDYLQGRYRQDAAA